MSGWRQKKDGGVGLVYLNSARFAMAQKNRKRKRRRKREVAGGFTRERKPPQDREEKKKNEKNSTLCTGERSKKFCLLMPTAVAVIDQAGSVITSIKL